MELAEKLKAIRAAERLTQSEFCKELDFSLSTYKKWESSLFEMSYGPLSKIANHARFKKYTLWLMTGEAVPECGQVSPI
ncbi:MULTISPECIES: helix-turn-helix domain-containing protein [Pseudomonas]|uniref:helix-turn-helix domain-containing protein n=1 Tax=Pseudomonas TaxID=286 RepID=UPI000F47D39F|nr:MULTISPECIES: helix-turn-helix transcriptional regulator [Pseudomonas]MDP9518522.1 helix-turn-helix transcriptional regulator [Pseudomonas protegens]NBF12943.1 helix-turn-helix domain-containing protein [Pseudomonas sp. Fl4BN1]ROM40654.1 transcriptional regulator [Pseudomonas protegens]